jgi:hypothetical protein
MKAIISPGLVEARIREAISRGDFENLPGFGKPLMLSQQAELKPEFRLAHHVLQNAGIAPAWLEKQKDLRLEADKLRVDLKRAISHPKPEVKRAGQVRFRLECARLNQAIRSVNLEAPALSLQLRCINCDHEIRAALTGKR